MKYQLQREFVFTMKSYIDKFLMLGIEQLHPGQYQPRTSKSEFSENSLKNLIQSIEASGVVQPIIVKKNSLNSSDFEIISGERRWRAAQLAGLKEVPVVIRRTQNQEINKLDSLICGLAENIHRKDLNPVEEGRAIQRLREEFKMPIKDISTVLGRAPDTISHLLRILSLDPEVLQSLEKQEPFTLGHAKVLVGLPIDQQQHLMRHVLKDNLSVRQLERLVKNIKKQSKTVTIDPDIKQLEQRLNEQLAIPTQLQWGNGKGKLTFQFNSVDELEHLLSRLNLTDF